MIGEKKCWTDFIRNQFRESLRRQRVPRQPLQRRLSGNDLNRQPRLYKYVLGVHRSAIPLNESGKNLRPRSTRLNIRVSDP